MPALTSDADDGTTAAATTTAGGTTDETSMPAATTSDGKTMPTLPSSSGSTTYSYPAPSVPPTQNAPFMQTSNLPEGTVFIAVGAILGAFGLGVLIWRAVVACLLHRSVKRAALAQGIANDKPLFPGNASAPFYKYSDRASSASLGGAIDPAIGRGVRRTSRVPVPSSTPSQSNLFFSPTARSGMDTAGNRSSTFLPSGFYAAGQGAPQQGHGHSISLTNLRPDSRGQPKSDGHSPPDSPGLPPRHELSRRNLSASTINLNQPASGRAPSTYLEDLLGDQVPGQFPPPGHNQNWRQSRDRF
ncbi:uncharacterized protein BCR38DRAFT_331399 [Pseudomassariella vexata]|uniref:Uncharacterized protein n=1 Tax=Pseudomassariella vexata TaxID=1141098 RepID=A0A1Y2EKE7_9PEZI|nr:uncharacterized protein BCR38DRAFT_331399 [Pseudomassariella vexata]ORY72007.1 hypothetical protein BCR38DRAFT_331399 [Pseudomassariella vexata]